ncbi:hypothetical protein ABPG75_006731 [Micractinium tetrahymenae]
MAPACCAAGCALAQLCATLAPTSKPSHLVRSCWPIAPAVRLIDSLPASSISFLQSCRSPLLALPARRLLDRSPSLPAWVSVPVAGLPPLSCCLPLSSAARRGLLGALPF